MKKFNLIFLILISCLCLAVVSCADKEESSADTPQSTSSSGSDNGTNWVRIGNVQIVSGTTSNVTSVDIGKPFLEGIKIYISYQCYSSNFSSNSSGFNSLSGTTWSINCSDNLVYYMIGNWK